MIKEFIDGLKDQSMIVSKFNISNWLKILKL